MDELYYKTVDLLRTMIETPSVSRSEDNIADVIVDFLSSEGIDGVTRVGNNILVMPELDPDKRTILLNSHIDTVPPADGWTRDPYSATLDADGDKLFGLGSNDAGASVVSLIATFITLNSTPQPYNLVLLLSAEEEVSGKNGIESMVTLLDGKIDFAIVGEPTGMRPAVSEKGLMVLDGEIYGTAGHAARDEGVNAIYKAIPVIETLRLLTFPKVSSTLGPIKISVTQIEAGKKHNMVPDLCKIVVDVRTTDVYSNTETLNIIAAAVPECRLIPRSTRLNPSGINVEQPFVRRASMLGLEPFGSPTLSDQALMPWPSVKIGPGDSARSHSSDEYILLSEIREAQEIYLQLLRGLKI